MIRVVWLIGILKKARKHLVLRIVAQITFTASLLFLRVPVGH